MRGIGWIGLVVAGAMLGAPEPVWACSPALDAHRALMGRSPDCFDSNTAAIYGNQARPRKSTGARQKKDRHNVNAK